MPAWSGKYGNSLPFLLSQIFKCLLCTKMKHFSSMIKSVEMRVGEWCIEQVWEVRWVQK